MNKRLDPKHQALVTMLIRNQLDQLPGIIDGAQAPTLFLSTEGLSYHFQDFRPATTARFREITRGMEVSLFMITRDRDSWLRSQHMQAVINPPVANAGYACKLRLEDYARTDRIRRLLDHDRLLAEMRVAYGAADVVAVDVGSDWHEVLARSLGVRLGPAFVAPSVANAGISDDLVELLRQLNALDLPVERRQSVLALIQESERTQINMMRSYRIAVTGQPTGKAEISESLRSLLAVNAAQRDILARAAVALSRLQDLWAAPPGLPDKATSPQEP